METQEASQSPELEQRERIAVWCGCLAAYNAGILHGDWLEADVEPDELTAGVERVLSSSPIPNAEEHFWADHEGFRGIRLGEYESVERVTSLARLLREYGNAYALLYSNDPSAEPDDAAFQDAYIGAFDSERELAGPVTEELVEQLPEWAQSYFDAEKYLNDLVLGGDVWTGTDSEYQLHAFWSR